MKEVLKGVVILLCGVKVQGGFWFCRGSCVCVCVCVVFGVFGFRPYWGHSSSYSYSGTDHHFCYYVARLLTTSLSPTNLKPTTKGIISKP